MSKVSKEYLLRIIDLCRKVKERGYDPFQVDVKTILRYMRDGLSKWKEIEEFKLDVEALRDIAEVIKLQGDWIAHEASSLYVDSLIVALKIKSLSTKSLARIFVKSWYPIVSLSYISQSRLVHAIDYWNSLLPIQERYASLISQQTSSKTASFDELCRLNVLSKGKFQDLIEELWKELIEKYEKEGEILYWKFVRVKSYRETVLRAYLVSFLTTYGYSSLRIDPISGEIYILPHKERKPIIGECSSLPISINYDQWKRGE